VSSLSANTVKFIDGSVAKNKYYRKKWVSRVRKLPDHPFNHGIHMDTHHLISAEGINISELGDDLVAKGYLINDINNLVGFPATLPGACFLKTQLHRGDHYHSEPGEEPYHKHVVSQLKRIRLKIESCDGRTKKRETGTDIHKLMDPIGEELLEEINDFELPLTTIFMNFHPSSKKKGCAQCFDVVPAETSAFNCAVNRLHSGEDFRYQDSEKTGNKATITYTDTWTPKVTK